jgi:hypothetical protein
VASELRETWLVVQHAVGDAASHACRNATTKQRQRSALWEQNLQRFDKKLHPRVFFNGQQGNDFRAGSDHNRNGSSSRGIHDEIASATSLWLDLQLDQPLLVIKDTIIHLSNLFFKFDLILKYIIKFGRHRIHQVEDAGS